MTRRDSKHSWARSANLEGMTRRDLKTLVDMPYGLGGCAVGSVPQRSRGCKSIFVHTYASNEAVNVQIVNPQRLH
jgi:hypothetical protein